MKIAETMCPVSTRAVSTHACLGHRGSARPPCQHVIGDPVLPGCSWGRQHRMGATAAFWPERPPKRLAEMEWLCREPPRSSSKHPTPAQAALQTICEMIYSTISVLSWKPGMAPGHNGNRDRCCEDRHLAEKRGRTRPIQTPSLHPGPRKPGTIEPDQTGQALADWRRGPAARGGRGGQQQRERSPQHDGSRGTAVTQG